jgi:hypothetical protein
LLVKAREAVKEKQVAVAENYFAQIIEKDPETGVVSQKINTTPKATAL